ncbi:MAG: hypothetical protein OHK0050_01920 [Roseiflexaceae bacterium]
MEMVGILIGLVAAIVFVLIGALTLFGSSDATRFQILPGFIPDATKLTEQILTLLSVWGPAILVAMLCLLAGIQIMQVVMRALFL